LHQYLAAMPWIGTAKRKEVHFFDKGKSQQLAIDNNDTHALNTYLNSWGPEHQKAPVLFEVCQLSSFPNDSRCMSPHSRCLQFSPRYMYERHAPYRMAQIFGPHLKNVRFLMVLRSPARRAFSGLFQQAPSLNASVFDVSAIGEMNALLVCQRNAVFQPHCVHPVASALYALHRNAYYSVCPRTVTTTACLWARPLHQSNPLPLTPATSSRPLPAWSTMQELPPLT
jgi:hypothetical protein